MNKWCRTACLVSAVGMMVLGGVGCAKKSLEADVGSQSLQQGEAAMGGSGDQATASTGLPGGSLSERDLIARTPASPDPGATGSGGSGSAGGMGMSQEPVPAIGSVGSAGGPEPLGGFEPVTGGKAPKEESVDSGIMVAKADPSAGTGERLEELQREQLATATAGLQDVFFGFDSWTLTADGRQSLTQAAKWLRANPAKRLTIEGHCDQRGTLSYNFVLGEKRALAIRNYLVELGVDKTRLMVVSYGKERPFCNQDAEDCYQQNRRGHLAVRAK